MFPTDFTEEYQAKHPVHAALLSDNLGTIGTFLKKGYSVNKRDNRGRTPLHFAIEHAKNVNLLYGICKLLLDHGADVKCRDFDKRTLLHCMYDSCVRKNVNDDGRLLDMFIERGANVNAKSRYQESPLLLAVEAGNVNAAKKLLESGAQLKNIKFRGESILAHTIRRQNVEMIKLMLSFNVNVNDASAVGAAVENNDVVIVRLIIEYGALVSKSKCTDFSYVRPLIDSVITKRHPDVIESLLEKEYRIMFASKNRIDVVTQKTSIIENAYNHEYIRLSTSNRQMDIERFSMRKKILQAILKHIAILNELGDVSFKEFYVSFIDVNKPLKDGLGEYLEQIRIMKNTFVRKDSRITYFDVLSKCENPLVKCCDDETVSVLSENVTELFPNFADKILRNVRRGLFEKRTRQDAIQFLYEHFESTLPFDIIRYICDFLTLKDLGAFIVPVDVWLENYF